LKSSYSRKDLNQNKQGKFSKENLKPVNRKLTALLKSKEYETSIKVVGIEKGDFLEFRFCLSVKRVTFRIDLLPFENTWFYQNLL